MARLADYGKQGLIGVLTPQANTTVEPELWVLAPPGGSLLNARLVSSLDTIEQRLADYAEKFSTTAEQFANAPIEALAIACTGTSYLLGKQREQSTIDAIEARYGIPCVTAAVAAVAALNAMGAQRLALLTPYPESLNKVSERYWQSQGFEVITKAGPALETGAFHPIYAMSGAGVYQAYQQLSAASAEHEIDAVLMLGTGMATLQPLLRGQRQGLIPAISCNLALAWATWRRLQDKPTDAESIDDWRCGGHWQQRLSVLLAEQ